MSDTEYTKPKAIVLPERDEMHRRLLSVMDDPHAEEKLYPLLLEHAGKTKTAIDILRMFMDAISTYTEGAPPYVAANLYMHLSGFSETLIDDEGVRNETLAELRKMGFLE